MSDIIITLIADGLMAILLLFTIIYSVKLNKRIRVLQDSKGELAKLIKRFDESTTQATIGINEIHKASKIINEHIQTHIEKANFVADDLAFMIEKGGSVAKKLDPENNANKEVEIAEKKPAIKERGRRRARESSIDDKSEK